MPIASAATLRLGNLAGQGLRQQRGRHVVGGKRRHAKGFELVQDLPAGIPHADHPGRLGTGTVTSGSSHFAAGGLSAGVHDKSSSCVDPTYAGEGKLSLPTRDRVLSQAPTDGTIVDRLSTVFRAKAVKVLANAADTCQGAVKQWRAGASLPSVAALIRLIAADDEIFEAVMELAGRGNRLPVGQMLAQLEADLAELKAFAKGESNAPRAARDTAGRLSGDRRLGDGPGRRGA